MHADTRCLSGAIVASCLWPCAWPQSCPEGKSPLLILGSYHMSNPGLDSFNLQADDVLSPKRQHEIADVVELLARFAPTAPTSSPTGTNATCGSSPS